MKLANQKQSDYISQCQNAINTEYHKSITADIFFMNDCSEHEFNIYFLWI